MTEAATPIPLARPSTDEQDVAAVAAVIRSGWLTQGPAVAAFEAAFCERTGAPDAVAVSNCTNALHLAFVALGIGRGDEVICPSMSFIATVNAVVHVGAEPVLADVDDRTFNVTAATVSRCITPRTRAILLVHQIGLPADLDEIASLARDHGLGLVEDAACAIGSTYKGRAIGSAALGSPARGPGLTGLCCFSFHPRKLIATGDGGMITLGDSEQAARLRRLRQQGMSVSDLERHHSARVVTETYPEVGYNYRLTDVQAALGLTQLARLDDMLIRRREQAARYDAAFARHPRLLVPQIAADRTTNYQSYMLSIDGATASERDEIMNFLLERRIASRRGVMCAHREEPYRGALAPGGLSASERASDRSICLPIFHDLSATDQDRVIDGVLAALDKR
jgi:dTDP-4-amino-4,6-dideoxygalactose transaminase